MLVLYAHAYSLLRVHCFAIPPNLLLPSAETFLYIAVKSPRLDGSNLRNMWVFSPVNMHKYAACGFTYIVSMVGGNYSVHMHVHTHTPGEKISTASHLSGFIQVYV